MPRSIAKNPNKAHHLSAHYLALREAALEAKSQAGNVSCAVLQGRATQADKDAAWAIAFAKGAEADAQLKIEMRAAGY